MRDSCSSFINWFCLCFGSKVKQRNGIPQTCLHLVIQLCIFQLLLHLVRSQGLGSSSKTNSCPNDFVQYDGKDPTPTYLGSAGFSSYLNQTSVPGKQTALDICYQQGSAIVDIYQACMLASENQTDFRVTATITLPSCALYANFSFSMVIPKAKPILVNYSAGAWEPMLTTQGNSGLSAATKTAAGTSDLTNDSETGLSDGTTGLGDVGAVGAGSTSFSLPQSPRKTGVIFIAARTNPTNRSSTTVANNSSTNNTPGATDEDSSTDADTSADAGSNTDAATSTDPGSTDAGTGADAGTTTDAGSTDAGTSTDTDTSTDAATSTDPGSTDAGTSTDADTSTDAGSSAEPDTSTDADTTTDASSGTDTGTSRDAATTPTASQIETDSTAAPEGDTVAPPASAVDDDQASAVYPAPSMSMAPSAPIAATPAPPPAIDSTTTESTTTGTAAIAATPAPSPAIDSTTTESTATDSTTTDSTAGSSTDTDSTDAQESSSGADSGVSDSDASAEQQEAESPDAQSYEEEDPGGSDTSSTSSTSGGALQQSNMRLDFSNTRTYTTTRAPSLVAAPTDSTATDRTISNAATTDSTATDSTGADTVPTQQTTQSTQFALQRNSTTGSTTGSSTSGNTTSGSRTTPSSAASSRTSGSAIETPSSASSDDVIGVGDILDTFAGGPVKAQSPPGAFRYDRVTNDVIIPGFWQCGGKGAYCSKLPEYKNQCFDAPFLGATCDSGYLCRKQNTFYWQCM